MDSQAFMSLQMVSRLRQLRSDGFIVANFSATGPQLLDALVKKCKELEVSKAEVEAELAALKAAKEPVREIAATNKPSISVQAPDTFTL